MLGIPGFGLIYHVSEPACYSALLIKNSTPVVIKVLMAKWGQSDVKNMRKHDAQTP